MGRIEMKIRKRTFDERKAYADGYKEAFRMFCEYLKERPQSEAIERMQSLVDAVTYITEPKGE